jgi:hypothetical protein
MSSNRRGLRSGSVANAPLVPLSTDSSPVWFNKALSPPYGAIRIVRPGTKLPDLTAADLQFLREKQKRLRSTASTTLTSVPPGNHLRNALESTLIFAQYEAGTAVCIDPAGWILTCAHCFGDDEEEYKALDKRKWMLFYTGLAIQVVCRFRDPQRDLALLKVIAIETDDINIGSLPVFRSVSLSMSKIPNKTPILCIGQPGRDDLESTSNRKTKYNLVELSEGMFRGMVRGVDPQDNSDIGTLMHDAWTYWGHSGAPLIREADGTLIGLHSSWDDMTAMRHGVPAATIREFLQMHLPAALGIPSSTGTAEFQVSGD